MSWDSFTYLLQYYWPFLTAALVVGILTGWFSRSGGAGTPSAKDAARPHD
jgi:hypothetical protein